DFYRRAGAMRRQYSALRHGRLATLYANRGIYACLRFCDEQDAVVIFNTNLDPVQMDVSGLDRRFDGRRFRAVWNGEREPGRDYVVREETLAAIDIPARDAVVLVSDNPDN